MRQEMDWKECIGAAEHTGLEEELMHAKMEAERTAHKLEMRLELLASECVETKALCETEMRAETASCRASLQQADGYMSGLEPEIAEFQRVLDVRSAQAQEQEEALEQTVASGLVEQRASEEMALILTRELQDMRSEHEVHSSRASEKIQMLLSKLSTIEADRNEVIAHGSEADVALERLQSAVKIAEAEEREAAHSASELPPDDVSFCGLPPHRWNTSPRSSHFWLTGSPLCPLHEPP